MGKKILFQIVRCLSISRLVLQGATGFVQSDKHMFQEKTSKLLRHLENPDPRTQLLLLSRRSIRVKRKKK